ncbi:MAG TPA: vitamin K epoxide reductase family protein, partial [Gemmataceae bacterium]|nr:vitamin K epoxide reductase family protein [Gemmataceae bacterium]
MLATALAGCGIATYLTLYQVDIVSHVWEPLFGDGSRYILKESAVARNLPIPDAALGAAAYLAEAILELIGGDDRWRTRPRVVLLL